MPVTRHTHHPGIAEAWWLQVGLSAWRVSVQIVFSMRGIVVMVCSLACDGSDDRRADRLDRPIAMEVPLMKALLSIW
jgi:hypothetical protein